MPDNSYQTANALKECFISPNVSDSNLEPANIVDVIENLSRGIHRIADALDRIAAAMIGAK
jgi:hypothetical protein